MQNCVNSKDILVDNVQNNASSLDTSRRNKNLSSARDMSKKFKNRKESSAIPSGFSSLDKIIKGFKKSNFVVIGSRPSVGKTSFVLNIASNLCQQNRRVGFFTLEVSDYSLFTSLVAINSGVEYDKLEDKSLMDENERQKCVKACSKLENFSFYIENTHNIQIHQLKAEARKMKKDYGVEIIFIDYISLISVEHNNTPRYEQVAFLSRNIRALANELEIPIIVLSQLNREAEGKAPNLTNLRESGSLEQDADIVIFLHREYEEQQEDNDEEVRKVKVIVAKNRHGAIGIATIGFEPKYTKFMDVGVG
ncbi:DnaB helicase C-terminal domain-containing protein [Borreliella bavariensis]|uniref:DnaB helicase C-terminal domain-containing protein n=1 Tax=Borreliella bavariensis TaxID=664662 RepID=UPI001C004821|nr:DnaB helicase C-terminal domain-containing protein [Borreliella bavariensis]